MTRDTHVQALVLGAGLSGLTAARDLMNQGIDVLVLEARDRPGGRVEQVALEDGRLVQLGGEVIGGTHHTYRALVAELGLTMRPGYASEPGENTWDLLEGHVVADEPTWLAQEESVDAERVFGLIAALVAEVDKDDPWGHPQAELLDSMSIGDWLRSVGATAGVLRLFELDAAGLGGGSIERGSMLAHLRRLAAVEMSGDFTETVVEGSATVALRMADELGDRLRLNSIVASIEIAAEGAQVTLTDGSEFTADAVVCTIPVGPLRNVDIAGLSAARLDSLRRQRQSSTSKVVLAYDRPLWQDAGANGTVVSERTFGVTWSQGNGILSMTINPERLAHHLNAPPHARREEILAELARMWGEDALEPVDYLRRDWVNDPYTLGYTAYYATGDLTAIGPLHGTHEPPFFVAGSDHWYAGYMEGAVATGRATAAEVVNYLRG